MFFPRPNVATTAARSKQSPISRFMTKLVGRVRVAAKVSRGLSAWPLRAQSRHLHHAGGREDSKVSRREPTAHSRVPSESPLRRLRRDGHRGTRLRSPGPIDEES